MKSLSNIYERLLDIDNIKRTIQTSMRRKKKTKSIKNFVLHSEENAEKIRCGIIDGTLLQQHQRTPKIIHEPSADKDRVIYPPNNIEHVVHHLVCEAIMPILRNGMYDFCVASVPNRGDIYGLKYMRKWIKSYKDRKLYVLKLDIHHFFDSVDRRILFNKLSKHINDKRFNEVLRRIIWYDGDECRIGIPIGFYTSQWFANYYLQDFDHFVKQELHIPHYMRYMDDMVMICPNKRTLRRAYGEIVRYLSNIGLSLNGSRQLFLFSYIDDDGMERGRAIDFMGYVFHRNRITMRKRTLLRATRKARRMSKHSKTNWYEATQLISMTSRMKRTDTYMYFERNIKQFANIGKLRRVISRHGKYKFRNERSV